MNTRQRNREADFINADLLWEPWAFGCLEGRRREGAIMVQQRCQWSAEYAGVTSGREAARRHQRVLAAVSRVSKGRGALASTDNVTLSSNRYQGSVYGTHSSRLFIPPNPLLEHDHVLRSEEEPPSKGRRKPWRRDSLFFLVCLCLPACLWCLLALGACLPASGACLPACLGCRPALLPWVSARH